MPHCLKLLKFQLPISLWPPKEIVRVKMLLRNFLITLSKSSMFTFIVVELKMKFGFYRVWLLTEIGFWRAFSHEILSRCLNAELNIRLIILYSRQIWSSLKFKTLAGKNFRSNLLKKTNKENHYKEVRSLII